MSKRRPFYMSSLISIAVLEPRKNSSRFVVWNEVLKDFSSFVDHRDVIIFYIRF